MISNITLDKLVIDDMTSTIAQIIKIIDNRSTCSKRSLIVLYKY